MRPVRFSVLVVLSILLLTLALALLDGDSPIPVAVEPALADSPEDDENHPPVAAATIQEDPGNLWTNMSIHFSSEGSYDIDGNGSINFTWDFGDGTDPSTLANPIHIYEVPATYNVTLTVIDQSNVIAEDALNLSVRRNYGNTELIIEAVGSNTQKIFYDPAQGDLQKAAVMRDGWVAYQCDLRADQDLIVNITIIGDRPADIFLFEEVHFQTYKNNPQVTFVPFRADGLKLGATGEFNYLFTASETDRYYIVIDNKDRPLGTDTEGPVDYTIIIDPTGLSPVAVATIQEDPRYLWVNMAIHFSSMGSYDIHGEGRISFTWDFDDGTDPSILAHPEHIYADPGTYTVILTVIDKYNVMAHDTIILTVQRDYGDTEIIIKAPLEDERTFYDPAQGEPQIVAVMRDGWVAYLCELRADHEITVEITIIGDRPADVYLFDEVNFQTYKRDPQVNFVPFEAEGSEQGALGVFKYSFKASETDRYYIVIDNKDWPTGTEAKGPVDYTISINPEFPPRVTSGEGIDAQWIIMVTFAILVVIAVVYIFYRRSEM